VDVIIACVLDISICIDVGMSGIWLLSVDMTWQFRVVFWKYSGPGPVGKEVDGVVSDSVDGRIGAISLFYTLQYICSIVLALIG